VWDLQLAQEGSRIAKSRAGFIKRLESLARENHAFLTSDKEVLTLEYEGVTGEDASEICEKMLEILKADREKDLKQGYTHSGIQTDDIKVAINGIDVRKFGSQGQQRTAALALKMSEVDLYYQEKGEYRSHPSQNALPYERYDKSRKKHHSFHIGTHCFHTMKRFPKQTEAPR
jgi:DNA replication and repair protein RecF